MKAGVVAWHVLGRKAEWFRARHHSCLETCSGKGKPIALLRRHVVLNFISRSSGSSSRHEAVLAWWRTPAGRLRHRLCCRCCAHAAKKHGMHALACRWQHCQLAPQVSWFVCACVASLSTPCCRRDISDWFASKSVVKGLRELQKQVKAAAATATAAKNSTSHDFLS